MQAPAFGAPRRKEKRGKKKKKREVERKKKELKRKNGGAVKGRRKGGKELKRKKTSSELQYNVLIRRVIDSYKSISLVFIYRDFNTGKQHMRRIQDLTLRGQHMVASCVHLG